MRLPILGQWTCSQDGKRRILMPIVVRKMLEKEEGTHLVTTVGHKGCIYVIPISRWEKESPDFLHGMFEGNAGAISLRDALALYGKTTELDGTGRLTLSELQVEVANLGKKIIIFGNFNRLEIWEPERFAREHPKLTDQKKHDDLTARFIGRGGLGGPPQ